jgi:hypothetical protein
MNDQRDPNTKQQQDSIEARLARAAQQLDTAAANYAYRTHADVATSATTGSDAGLSLRGGEAGRGSKRRFAPFAAIGGAVAFAASLMFGASVISNQAEKSPVTIPVEIASPTTSAEPTSDFPFVGELTVLLPSDSVKSGTEELTFRDGEAISSVDQQRFTLASAIDIDIDTDGTNELAVLINRPANGFDTAPTVPTVPIAEVKNPKATKSSGLSKKSPSKLSKLDTKAVDVPSPPEPTTQATSAVAVVQIANGVTKTLAVTPGFATHYDTLLMNRKTLWAMRLLGNRASGSGEAILQRARIDTNSSVVDWEAPESPIARTVLPLIEGGDRQIRFLDGTTSALVFTAGGTRRGWFTARAGQTLTIETIGIPSNNKRQITLLKRKGSNDQQPGTNGVLPGPFTTVLPHGGDYEIVVSEGTETTFELSIK